MKISEIMTKLPDVQSCLVDHTLAHVAQLMHDRDIGALPVIDDAGIIHGMITDRDALMAAYEHDRRLSDIIVRDAMSTNIVSCREDDRDDDVARLMANAQVLRPPQRVIGANRPGRSHDLSDLHSSLLHPRVQQRACHPAVRGMHLGPRRVIGHSSSGIAAWRSRTGKVIVVDQ